MTQDEIRSIRRPASRFFFPTRPPALPIVIGVYVSLFSIFVFFFQNRQQRLQKHSASTRGDALSIISQRHDVF